MNTNNHDDLAHIDTMNAEQLREELRAAVKFHRECLVSNWQIKKNLADENKMLRSTLEKSMSVVEKATGEIAYFSEVMDKGASAITMWKRTSYALALLVVVLAIVIAKGIAA
ncbi:MAG: hypothetical protein WA154_02595 [Moraxellaceae bacterium]